MRADLILVGGGLANGLIALRLAARRPDLRVLLLEQAPALGGNHTWCFHGADLARAQVDWLCPLIEASWPGYTVRFPGHERRVGGSYHAVVSTRLHDTVASVLGDQVICNATAVEVRPGHVRLADGREYFAPAVIDGRGGPAGPALRARYQKFVGRVVRLGRPHELAEPLLMDATVAQLDGFRFVYVLPFTPDRLLIEDTRYSDGPELDHASMRREIDAYAARAGWAVTEVLREEHGVLPVITGGDIDAFWAEAPGVPRSGVRAGFFNYTTGYSFPEAVRCAEAVASLPDPDSAGLYAMLRARSERLWRRGGFLRALNRMLFLAGEPDERYRVLRHFYRLPDATLNRFYAGRPNTLDRLRILSGRPPVPVPAAFRAMMSDGA